MNQATPIKVSGRAYDAETLDLLRAVLDDAWSKLSELQRIQWPRSKLAERLLNAAAEGVRDPDVLLARALDGTTHEAPLSPA